MSLDRLFARVFGDDQPTRFGSGWLSGVVGVVAGFLALGGVICFHFPDVLTTPALRQNYPVAAIRIVLGVLLGTAFVMAALSAVLRRRKVLSLVGLAFAALAALLGGPWVPLPDRVDAPIGLGLDWFLLDLFVLALLFVPLERAWPRNQALPVFRPGWTTDGLHFLASHLLVQLFSFVGLAPGRALQGWASPVALIAFWENLPTLLQVLAVIVVADLAQYWVHRFFHRFSRAWRFHAIHHSSPALDWLAASRIHVVDAVVTRTLVLVPAFLIGLPAEAIAVYLVFVSFHAVFIHANLDLRLRWLEPLLVTPRIHHFHHASEPEAIDKNFAVHLPIIDRLLGTRFLPEERWPHAYGLAHGVPPEGWAAQCAAPFKRTNAPAVEPDGNAKLPPHA